MCRGAVCRLGNLAVRDHREKRRVVIYGIDK